MGKSLSKEEEQQVKKRTKELDGPKHRTSFIDSRELFLHLKSTNTKTTWAYFACPHNTTTILFIEGSDLSHKFPLMEGIS